MRQIKHLAMYRHSQTGTSNICKMIIVFIIIIIFWRLGIDHNLQLSPDFSRNLQQSFSAFWTAAHQVSSAFHTSVIWLQRFYIPHVRLGKWGIWAPNFETRLELETWSNLFWRTLFFLHLTFPKKCFWCLQLSDLMISRVARASAGPCWIRYVRICRRVKDIIFIDF